MVQVVKYQNYGCMNWGPIGDDDNSHKIKWYYCFFELNNGTVIYSQFEKYWNNGVVNDNLDFFLTKNYKFGQDFWSWWETTFKKPDEKSRLLTSQERVCVKEFFYKKIKK